ncbi:MAG: sialate O-acetylesterase, partial [Hungatella sp.]
GGPYVMELEDGNIREISNILIGDIWLLGGQSNMSLPIARTLDCTKAELEGKREFNIRMFQVPEQTEFQKPTEVLQAGAWTLADSDQIMDFSAAGYFFARELVRTYGIPIGLLQTAVGGTPVEAWMSEESLKDFKTDYEMLWQAKDATYVQSMTEADTARIEDWFCRLNRSEEKKINWNRSVPIRIPGLWRGTSLEGYCGSVWFQKEIEIPKDWNVEEAELRLGTIVDADETYINDVLIGHTDYRYPPRTYKIPQGVLGHGINKITVRVICRMGRGGFIEGKAYELRLGEKTITLDGLWNCQRGTAMELLPEQIFFHRRPVGLYQGMICPLKDVEIKGVAFYQGESNSENPEGYHIKFKAMIEAWRQLFKQKELPFLYVQLANYENEDGIKNGFAKIREEQRQCLEIPHTAMAVTIDIGESNDLHPQNKSELGRRLALLARCLVYGESFVCAGPVLKNAEVEEDGLRLKFDSAGSGLWIKGSSPLTLFMTLENGAAKWVEAVAEGDDLWIPLRGREYPVMISYGWADNPVGMKLYNREGLPASPFVLRNP